MICYLRILCISVLLVAMSGKLGNISTLVRKDEAKLSLLSHNLKWRQFPMPTSPKPC